ncbi:MAG: hypothetical protein AABW90_01595 [Nanoarchaeota archaeon]
MKDLVIRILDKSNRKLYSVCGNIGDSEFERVYTTLINKFDNPKLRLDYKILIEIKRPFVF